MKKLAQRILEISKKYNLSHLGSCISTLPILLEIYKQKKGDEPFILSNGHAFLAQAVVLEHFGFGDAEKIYLHHGVHGDRCAQCHIDFSTGSLGHGIGGAVGMALADRTRKVWCIISDGESMEGSLWEALRIIHDEKIKNLKLYININGYSALGAVDKKYLIDRLHAFYPNIYIRETDYTLAPFLEGVSAHYITQ